MAVPPSSSLLLSRLGHPPLQDGIGSDASAESLVLAIDEAEDLVLLSWAAAALATRLAEAPDSVPLGAAGALVRRIALLDIDCGSAWAPLPEPKRAAASALLATLLELCHQRPDDLALCRGLVLRRGTAYCPAPCGAAAMTAVGSLTMVATAEKEVAAVEKAALQEANVEGRWLRVLLRLVVEGASGSHESGGAGFVHACQLLALLARGDADVSKVLINTQVIASVAAGVLRITSSRPGGPAAPAEESLGTAWLPLATGAVLFMEALVTEPDFDRFFLWKSELYRPAWSCRQRPEPIVDACLSALNRSLLRDGGHIVPQPLHLSSLRALAWIAHLNPEQARRMVVSNGLAYGAKVLAMTGADEEAMTVALAYIAAVSKATLQQQHRLDAHGMAEAVRRVSDRYPRSARLQDDAEQVLRACGDPRK